MLVKKIFSLIILISFGFTVLAQNCECTITEVENNMVNPCDLIVGTVVTVTTVDELRNAINEANANGGNRTILIADGVYPIASTSWYPYITASNVVFRSLSGQRDNVILTGNGMMDVAPGTEIGIYAVGDNIAIADLTIRDLGNHGIAVTGDSLFVHNVRIQNTFEQMIKGNNADGGGDYGRVQCSLFEYPAGVGPQWYIGGLDIHNGDYWIVRDNIFRDINSPSVAVAEHAIHFWNASSGNIIERNWIINCDRGVGFGLGDSPNEGGIIRNNMIYNDGSGLYDDVGIGLETSPNTKVYNNTIYIDYPNAIEYRFGSTTNVDISNNLTNKLIKSRNGGEASLSMNYTEAEGDWFVDLSGGDLRLAAENPLILDQGRTLSEVAVDIDQTPRPQFGGFDIGAHEYVLTTSVEGGGDNLPGVVVFPNPASDIITIRSMGREDNLNIVLYNALKQELVILKGQEGQLSSGIEVDVRNWASGIYYCHIFGGGDYGEIVKIAVLR